MVSACTLPVAVARVNGMVITDLVAAFTFPDGRLTLTGLMPGAMLEAVRKKTSAALEIYE